MVVDAKEEADESKATTGTSDDTSRSSSHAPITVEAAVAEEIAGAARVDRNVAPLMGSEDFSNMLNARPGAFIFIGNGDSAMVHHPEYDFNDEIIPAGCSYWSKLVEELMPAA